MKTLHGNRGAYAFWAKGAFLTLGVGLVGLVVNAPLTASHPACRIPALRPSSPPRVVAQTMPALARMNLPLMAVAPGFVEPGGALPTPSAGGQRGPSATTSPQPIALIIVTTSTATATPQTTSTQPAQPTPTAAATAQTTSTLPPSVRHLFPSEPLTTHTK